MAIVQRSISPIMVMGDTQSMLMMLDFTVMGAIIISRIPLLTMIIMITLWLARNNIIFRLSVIMLFDI